MKLRASGIGFWTPGIQDWAHFCTHLGDDQHELSAAKDSPPPADLIPAREKRRAPRTARIAIEVADQACRMAKIDAGTVPSVFVSCMGDTDITDYMCRALTLPEKVLSPTRFHNSVHNAPSGYWSIATGNRATSAFVGGFPQSVAVGLLEAAALAVADETPVLLIAYAIAVRNPLHEVYPSDRDLGFALALTRGDSPAGAMLDIIVKRGLPDNQRTDGPALQQSLAHDSPLGTSLDLLGALATSATTHIDWPVGDGCTLHIGVDTC